jgi:Zn-dependent protease
MNGNTVIEIALFAIPVIVAITFHEAAHGYVALYCGDDTAKKAGRLSLNPLRHIDPFGTVILPLLLYMFGGFLFGYAKPVPVNFRQLKNPRWDMIWVAAAGPGMNFLLAIVSAVLLRIVTGGSAAELAANALLVSIQLNLILAVFNLIPFPPLDGSKVLAPFLPFKLAERYLSLGRYGMLLLLLILVLLPIIETRTGMSLNVFGWLVARPAAYLQNLLLGFVGQS